MVAKCKKCDTDNPADTEYCRNCGKHIMRFRVSDIDTPSPPSNETNPLVWKVLGTIFIIALAIFLIYELNSVGKTGVLMAGFYSLREIWKDS